MSRIIECVPNFSEGRNKAVIDEITREITSVEGVKLLDVDMGYEMNRTVVTFTGTPEQAEVAAFLSIKKASELINMETHRGSHPRMGATDVFPLIPVAGVSIEECISISRRLAEKVGAELGIPVYLYERSALIEGRTNLADIRKGEYEGLKEKIKKPEWKPDFGPDEINSRSGATVIGVREFLIAYNINLNTREKRYATDIAFEIREKGRSVRHPVAKPFYFKGEKILKYKDGQYPSGLDDFIGSTIEETTAYCRDNFKFNLKELLKQHNINPSAPEGVSVKKPGKFKNCKAIGWFVPEFDRAQISINLTDFHITSMHHVIEESRKLAEERGLIVTGSEIVGMVPFEALLETGKFYLKKQGRSTGIPVKDILQTAVQSLGLNDLYQFNIKEKVLGLPDYSGDDLSGLTIRNFIDEVSRETPAPGGGSVSALSGAVGSALNSMVSNLTIPKKISLEDKRTLLDAADKCQEIKDKLTTAIDKDTEAFNEYMAARKLPEKSEEQKTLKKRALLEGLKKAASVPLETAELCKKALDISLIVARLGNKSSITDVGVGAYCAFTGLTGGIYNVLINLKNIDDDGFSKKMREKCTDLKNEALKVLIEVEKIVESEL